MHKPLLWLFFVLVLVLVVEELPATVNAHEENCFTGVIKIWTTVPIAADIKPLVVEARQFYDDQSAEVADSSQQEVEMVPKMSASCEELDRMVYGQLGPKFPCWKGSMSDNRFNPLLYILEEFRLSYEQVSYIKAVHEALYACKYRRFAGRAMRADGVYQVFSGWKHEPEIPSDTREECIRKFINYMDTLLPFPAIIQERLEEARQYYHRTEPLPGDYIEPLGDNKRCRDMHHKIISVRKRMVPCWAYEHIVDEKTQSMIESQTKSSKAMVELGFVCHYGLNAGPAMRKAGLFEEITDWYVPNDTREQCMNKAKNYFSSLVPFADDLQAFIKESRDYYHLDETLPGYRAPPESDSCKKLRDAVYIEINDTVPCWKFEHIIDQDQAWDELFDRSKDFKRVREALEVCSEGHNAGVTLKQDRLVLDDILSSDD